MMKKLTLGLALVVLGTGIAGAHTTKIGYKNWNDDVQHVPEMDATSALGAMTLLLGGLVVLAGRKASK